MKHKFISILLVVLSCISCTNKTKDTNIFNLQQKELDTQIDSMLIDSEFIGIGIGVIKNGEVVYTKGFGHSNIENQKPYTKITIQPIGSISKLFIGLALVKAIQQGYFDLETKIDDILPFKIINPYKPLNKITIFHLVTHTSGIRDSDFFWSNCYFIKDASNLDRGTKHIISQHEAKDGDVLSLEELIKSYFVKGGKCYNRANFIETEVGERYEYSNIGSSLAAYLIEVKTGKSFKEFCRENIFEPLNMKNTSWQTPKEQKLMSTLYRDKKTPIPSFQLSSYPDGGLHTNIEDLTIFLSTMIKGYNGQSKFMPKEKFDLLFDKKFENLPNDFPDGTNSGVFWDWKRSGRLGHNGSDPGLFTDLSFDTESKSGTIILFNKEIVGVDDWKVQYLKVKEMKELLFEFEMK